MQEIDLVAATVWGPEVGAEIAATRTAHEDSERLLEDSERLLEAVANSRRTTEAAIDRVGAAVMAGVAATVAVKQELEATNDILAAGFDDLLEVSYRIKAKLSEILAVLKSPRATEANELVERAMFAFQSGVDSGDMKWSSDAERDFREAVAIDPYHAVAYWYLARIALDQRQDPETALGHFSECARLAGPMDASLTSLSLSWASRIQLAKGEFVEAAASARAATNASPSSVASLQLAAALARLEPRQVEEIRTHVSNAVIDSFYAIAADRHILQDDRIAAFLDHVASRILRVSKAIRDELQTIISDAESLHHALFDSAAPEVLEWIGRNERDENRAYEGLERGRQQLALIKGELDSPDVTRLIDYNEGAVTAVNDIARNANNPKPTYRYFLHQRTPRGWKREVKRIDALSNQFYEKYERSPYERPILGVDFVW